MGEDYYHAVGASRHGEAADETAAGSKIKSVRIGCSSRRVQPIEDGHGATTCEPDRTWTVSGRY
jgi:hypothetical protein